MSERKYIRISPADKYDHDASPIYSPARVIEIEILRPEILVVQDIKAT